MWSERKRVRMLIALLGFKGVENAFLGLQSNAFDRGEELWMIKMGAGNDEERGRKKVWNSPQIQP
jgi:hypothetical protein